MFSITTVLRTIFFWLDGIIYNFIVSVYKLFIMLSETTIFSQDAIKEFSTRVYVLISLIVAFRLALAFINYIVSPDSMGDKAKGGSALLKNLVISMALLVSVPALFNEAYYLQTIIIKEGIVSKLILGVGGRNLVTDQDANDSVAIELSTTLFLSFVYPNPRIAACSEETPSLDDDVVFPSDACVKFLNDNSGEGKEVGTDYKKAVTNLNINYIFNSNANNQTYVETAATATGYSELEVYLLNYQWGLSTIAGIVLVLLLISFCFDVAVRMIKLGFLQLIAPIPILMNIAPGDKKNDMLSKWAKECFSTWGSLFIRIATVVFSVYLIRLVNAKDGIISILGRTNNTNTFFVNVFIIFGILIFAKQFPKLLEDVLGIKMSGKMYLNPFKKLGEEAVGGKALTGFVGGALAGAEAGLLGTGNPLKALGGALRGGAAGAKEKDFGAAIKKGNQTAVEFNKRQREQKYSDSTFFGRRAVQYNKLTGAEVGNEHAIAREKREIEEKIKEHDEKIKSAEEKRKVTEQTLQPKQKIVEDRKAVVKLMDDMKDVAVKDATEGKGSAGAELKRLEAQLEYAKSNEGKRTGGIAGIQRALEQLDNYRNNELEDRALLEHLTGAVSSGKFSAIATRFNEVEGKEKGLNTSTLDAQSFKDHSTTFKKEITSTEIKMVETERAIKSIDEGIKAIQAQKTEFDKRKRALEEKESKLKDDQAATGSKK